MTNRHNTMKKGWYLVLGALMLSVGALPPQAAAQDLDPYHAFMLEQLANVGITGGDLVLGTDNFTLLSNTGNYGTTLLEVRPGSSAGDHEFDYIHVEVSRLTNQWDAGINWPGTIPVAAGETGLAAVLVRGATNEGGEGQVTFIYERNSDPWEKSLDRVQPLSSDWRLHFEPFTFGLDLPAAQSQMAFHLAWYDQWVEMTVPVVINFHDAYSEAELAAIIEQGGGTPTVARFTVDEVVGPIPFEVSFDASGTTTGGTITNYDWTFGDGNSGTGQTVSHTYQEPGSYTVTLTVTDNSNNTATATRTVTATRMEGSILQPIQIPYTAAAPVIDGVREAAWDNATAVGIETHVNDSPPSSEEDLSGDVRILWDDTHLFVFYTVRDEVQHNVNNDTWRDDSVDLYLDAQNNKSESYNLNYQAQIELGWDATAVTGKGPSNLANVSFQSVTTDDGYVIEAAVPWADFGFAPANDAVIGIEFMISDNDTGTDARQTKLAWFGMEDNAWQFPRLFGNAVLIGKTVSAEGESEVPEAFAIESVYPNPFNPTTTVAVQVRDVGEYRVRVYNVLGQIVAQQQVTATSVGRMEIPLAFSSLASGLYSIAVEHKATGKIVSATAVLMK